MVTSPYKRKILERDVKLLIINQSIITDVKKDIVAVVHKTNDLYILHIFFENLKRHAYRVTGNSHIVSLGLQVVKRFD